MAIDIKCSQCLQRYRVPDNSAGRQFRCKSCGILVTVGATPNTIAANNPPGEPLLSPPLSNQANSSATRAKGGDDQTAVGRNDMKPYLPLIATASACAVLAVIVATAFSDGSSGEGPPVAAKPAVASANRIESAKPPEEGDADNSETYDLKLLASEELVKLVSPSLVTIIVQRGNAGGAGGSGFVVNEVGWVITNYHVIEGATEAEVVFTGTDEPVDVDGWLAYSIEDDLALLRISTASVLKPLRLAAREPNQGQDVMAFGSPQGFAASVSEGIVSAVRAGSEIRSLIPDKRFWDRNPNIRWVQTTASFSPGNSGGPLVNYEGAVVGVNTWVHTDGQNLNFSISALDVAGFLEGANARVKSLASLPEPRPDPGETARRERDRIAAAKQAEDARRLDDLREAVEAETIAANDRQRNAIEEARRVEKEIERQQELNRLNEQIRTLRAELALIESEGASLTTSRGEVMAKGKALYLQLGRINARGAAIDRRLAFIGAAISRRESAAIGGPIFLDGDPTPFNQAGANLLRAEALVLQTERVGLQQDFQSLNSVYVALDAQARDLADQIAYKAAQRDQRQAELNSLRSSYESLARSGN